MSTGIRIQARRKQLRLTQAALATRLGVRTSKVSHWETGYTAVKAEELVALARALKTSCQKLVA